ncbi:HAMP domain-containing histidine kinase [Fulvivirga maritima]|uniref:sensor histidine kinase n=1 Tax=Fulvivirga maritima TaxID=2904247 RepID=UPI001F3BD8EA|nr:HAMP domain-containing sensor histidine kinase [Fulvivirga maritima]UII26097.1 HAMP domain-containing histidine kinase [Fulvivirga maritima]
MQFRLSFRAKIITRLLLIIILSVSGIYILTHTYFWLVSFWLFLFSFILTYRLIRYLEKVKADLTGFLISVKQNDFSGNYSRLLSDKHDLDLHQAFNIITGEFQKLRKEKESNYHFLQTIVEHATVPMLSYREDTNAINVINQAAKELFKKPFINQIDSLKLINADLTSLILRIESGQKELIKLSIDNEYLNLSVSAKQIRLEGVPYKLISLQNIKAELDEKEVESWQRLIRVLTHEIKNSAIPISTLTSVIIQLITNHDGHLIDLSTLDEEDLNDLHLGIKTIDKRSKGLVHFINAYGELAKVPQPELRTITSQELFNSIIPLFKQQLEENDIHFSLSGESMPLLIDHDLIEQVLINIIKNAKEALVNTKNAEIYIHTYQHKGQKIIQIDDNGPGIPKEELDNIFIPFFTTKKDGSGIGLSLSRQIMRAHNGNIQVSSTDKGTSFYLQF